MVSSWWHLLRTAGVSVAVSSLLTGGGATSPQIRANPELERFKHSRIPVDLSASRAGVGTCQRTACPIKLCSPPCPPLLVLKRLPWDGLQTGSGERRGKSSLRSSFRAKKRTFHVDRTSMPRKRTASESGTPLGRTQISHLCWPWLLRAGATRFSFFLCQHTKLVKAGTDDIQFVTSMLMKVPDLYHPCMQTVGRAAATGSPGRESQQIYAARSLRPSRCSSVQPRGTQSGLG
jgi:hypothetical protein